MWLYICLTIVIVIIDDIYLKRKGNANIFALTTRLSAKEQEAERLRHSLNEYADKLGKVCLERDEAFIARKRLQEQLESSRKDVSIQKEELLKMRADLDGAQARICELAQEKMTEIKAVIELKKSLHLLQEQQPLHCAYCGKFLPRDRSLHIQRSVGPICKSCFEKPHHNKEV